MQTIKLKEHIGLDNYNWERSLVVYDISENFGNDYYCLKCNNEKLPCQIIDKGDGKYSVAFVSGLKSGEEKEFIFEKSEKEFDDIAYKENLNLILQNEHIKIVITPDTDVIFNITNSNADYNGISTASKPIKNKTVILEENGAVYATARIKVEFTDDDCYEISLKLVRELEYVILDESISTNNAYMQISWNGFNPTTRFNPGSYCSNQPVDQYLKNNNEIPVVVTPHDISNGSANTNFITFYNDKNSVGAFVGESIKWFDGRYEIESNSSKNALRFNYNETKGSGLVFKYPLNQGTRQTCVAIYKSEKLYNSKLKTHIRELQFWNYYIPLNSYKDWIFDYDDSDEKYPIFYDKNYYKNDKEYYFCQYEGTGVPPAKDVVGFIEDLRIIKEPWSFGPVWSRQLCEFIPLLDMRASEMDKAELKRCRNICILYAYYAMNENTFPTRHTLAGHPNFFMDYVSIVGLAAAMFPKHPDAKKWKDYYERALLLIMRFHIRPDVKTWKAKGGRHTENLGCYSWGSLKHIVEVSELVNATYSDYPALHPNYAKWADWYLNTLSAPVDGKRVIPPLGAHAGGHVLNPFHPTYFFRAMGKSLKNYSPLLAEQIYNVCPAYPMYQLESFIRNLTSGYINETTDVENTGIKPHLKSEKFTGYGCIMRSHVNEDKEMCVFLQQIDDGPNYRWGVACNGGCGNIYYYADNKRYSDNRKEDVGDDSMVDGTTSCTFTVLSELKTPKTVGPNELTYPLIDFGFCQYSRVNAGEYSNADYRYRSVLMADNDYIAIYDAVKYSRTHGRFSWFSNVSDDMPNIYQLKPGLKAREVLPPDISVSGTPYANEVWGKQLEFNKTRGVMYEGRGDFFTVVTHKGNLDVENKDYGTVIRNKNSTDYVFDASYNLDATDSDNHFVGKVGFIRSYDNNDIDMAIIEGETIKSGDVRMNIKNVSEYFSASLSKREDRVFGKCEGHGIIEMIFDNKPIGSKLYINNELVTLNSQKIEFEVHDGIWELTDNDPIPPQVSEVSYVEDVKGVNITWTDCKCREYIVNINGKEHVTTTPNLYLSLDKGKYIVNIISKNNNIFVKQSMDYPMYIKKDKPVKVEGLRITRRKNFFDIVWGEQLGILKYNLYRTLNGKTEILYSGTNTSFKECEMNDNAEYFVTAQNGFGESEKSHIRDTIPGGTSCWDPLPDEGFVRDTQRNEHGFPGYDFRINENRKILSYPD